MEPETINAVGQLIEKFGFLIFVALCALVFFWQMFSYMKATVTKKDADFLAYIESSNRQVANYVAKRDEQINAIVDNHNRAFQENSHALGRLSESIERRISRETRQDEKKNEAITNG
jgi:hypothetical protein